MQLFLSGGTGFVGAQVRRALLDQGHTIRMLVHKRRGDYEAGIEVVEGDITRLESFAHHLEGCSAIINLVGIIREFPASNMTFEKLHVQAVENLLEVARRAGIRRFIQMSALGTREQATSKYHQSKFRGEQLVKQAGIDFTIFRPSVIFGPKDDFVNKLAGIIRLSPLVPVIGDGNYRLQPIAVGDVARCFCEALTRPETIGQTYELCGPDRLTYNDMLDLIGRTLGKGHVTKVHNPLGIMKLVVPFMQQIPLFPITIDQIEMLVEDYYCDGNWRKTFPFEPLPFAQGIAAYLK
jgi:NADH dehydrogenase